MLFFLSEEVGGGQLLAFFLEIIFGSFRTVGKSECRSRCTAVFGLLWHIYDKCFEPFAWNVSTVVIRTLMAFGIQLKLFNCFFVFVLFSWSFHEVQFDTSKQDVFRFQFFLQ